MSYHRSDATSNSMSATGDAGQTSVAVMSRSAIGDRLKGTGSYVVVVRPRGFAYSSIDIVPLNLKNG
jgi:hypothetical protein